MQNEQLKVVEGLKFLLNRVKTLTELKNIILEYMPQNSSVRKISEPDLSRYLRGRAKMPLDKFNYIKKAVISSIDTKEVVKEYLKEYEHDNKMYYNIRPLLRHPSVLELLVYLLAQKHALYNKFDAIFTTLEDGILFAYAFSKELQIPFLWADRMKHTAFHQNSFVSDIQYEDAEQIGYLVAPKSELMTYRRYLLLIDYIRTGKTINALIELIEQARESVFIEEDKASVCSIIALYVQGDHSFLRPELQQIFFSVYNMAQCNTKL